jgi:hypothetical protein
MREAAISAGVPRASVYDVTLYLLAGLLVIGLVANLLVRPVARKWFIPDGAVTAAQPVSAARGSGTTRTAAPHLSLVLAWAAVGIPILWGVWITLAKIGVLFG